MLSKVRSISPPNFKKGKKREVLFASTRKNMPSYDVNIDLVMPSLTTGVRKFERYAKRPSPYPTKPFKVPEHTDPQKL